MADLAAGAAFELVRSARAVLNALKSSSTNAKSLLATWTHIDSLLQIAEKIPDSRLAPIMAQLRDLAKETRKFGDTFRARKCVQKLWHVFQDRDTWRSLERNTTELKTRFMELVIVLQAEKNIREPPPPPPPPPPQESPLERRDRLVLAFVNTATLDQLRALPLPRVGDAIASAIVAKRSRRGNFDNVDGLLDVDGVGPKTLQSILEAPRFC
jgi:DNA uptake protein ComE-like DNA-binding protein